MVDTLTMNLFARDAESYKVISRTVNISSIPTGIRKWIRPEKCKKQGIIGDCWTWTGFCDKGYGRFRWKGFKTCKAHRIVYQLFVERVADDLELDHLCLNRSCVNPSHLEPVTRLENIRRSHVTGNGNGTRTHCRRGHDLRNGGHYAYFGKRYCKICAKARQQDYEKKKAAKGVA